MTSASIPPPEADMTAERMLQRARDLIPVLRERAAHTEELRTLPQETVNEFPDAGFYRILQPKRFGGYELGLRTFCDVMIEISRGCTSSGWVLCLTSAHTFHMAAFAEEGQVEMYGDDGDFRAPLIFAPQGTAVPAEGGYTLNGRWNYNSGGEHSNWVAVSALVPAEEENAPPRDLLLAFISADDYTIHDNWFTMGMRGTGSKQAVVDNVFVPERRVISQPAWAEGKVPGFGVHDNPFYQTPHLEVFCAELCSICVGLGEAAIDAFVDRIETKKTTFPPIVLLKNDAGAQRHLGLARARVDAAAAILDGIVNNQDRYTQAVIDGTIEYSRSHSLKYMLLTNEVARLVSEAVDLLFRHSGTSAMQQGQVMERLYRDLATIRTHYLMDAERHAQDWGAAFFGLQPGS